MTVKNRGDAAVILAGWCSITAVALFRGPSGDLLSMFPLAAAAGFSAGSAIFPVLIILLSAGLFAPESLSWAVLAGGTLSALMGKGVCTRTAGFLSVAVSLWFTPLEFSIPLAAVSAAGAFFYRRKWLALAVAAGGFIVSLTISSLPLRSGRLPQTAGSFIRNDSVLYSVPSLYTGSEEVLLPAPSEGTWAMWLSINSGGVRDTIPMAAVSLGEGMIFLPAGNDTLCFTFSPGDTLRVALLRKFRPFNHSVVHLNAGGELL